MTNDWLNYWYVNRPHQLVTNFKNYYMKPASYEPYRGQVWKNIAMNMQKAIKDSYELPKSYVPLDSNIYGQLRENIYDPSRNHIELQYGIGDDTMLHEKTHSINH